jgi:hypothetical protein
LREECVVVELSEPARLAVAPAPRERLAVPQFASTKRAAPVARSASVGSPRIHDARAIAEIISRSTR